MNKRGEFSKTDVRAVVRAGDEFVAFRAGPKTRRGKSLSRSKRVLQRIAALYVSTHYSVTLDRGHVPYVPKDVLRGACRELGVYDQDVFSYYMADGRRLRRGGLSRETTPAQTRWFVETKDGWTLTALGKAERDALFKVHA